jgi:hypothetical protein
MKAVMFLMLLGCFRAGAQFSEMEQLRLDLEKLVQFKMILIQMQQGYQNLKSGYNSVRDVAKGNFNLHKNYLDGLLTVNPSVKNSPVLRQVASGKAASEKLYSGAIQQYRTSGLFSSVELSDLNARYVEYAQRIEDDTGLLDMVISSGKLRMSDAERLEVITLVQADVSVQHSEIKKMIDEYSKVMVVRQQQKKDNSAVKKLSGLTW